MSDDRIIPHNLDAEEAVIGAVLLDSESFKRVSDLIPSQFFRDKNQWVWQAVLAVAKKGEGINQVTVAHELSQSDRLEAIGGTAYLSNCIMDTPTSLHSEYYAGIIKKCADQRALIELGDTISDMGYSMDPEVATSEALEKLLALQGKTITQELELIGDYALSHYDEFTNWIDGGYQPTGVQTGFRDLDRIIGGLKPGKLYYVCARPSIGKSTFLKNIAKNIGKRGIGSAFFSLEESKDDVYESLVFAEARVNAQRISSGGTLESARELKNSSDRLKDKYSELMNLPIWIDDSASLKVQKAQSKLLRILAREDIKVMFFDHLGLAGDETKSGNEVQRIGRISKGLKAIPKICNVAVVAACQLSRDVSKNRSNHRPWLEDMRWAGELEQDVDVALGLYRDEYYHPEGTNEYQHERKNFMEISVLKQRRGMANPRGGVGTGIFHEVETGFMGDWSKEFPMTEL